MYSYEKFYDHFCIKEDNKIITHVDTEAEAKKIIFELNSENVDIDVEAIKNIGKNYTVYHLHTMYSLLDSTTSFEDYVDMAKSYGMTAIGCSEHGNIYGWYKKKMYAEKNGLKFLFGIECYLTETFDEKIRDNYHTILIAKNKDGMHEICRLFFNSTNKQHTYYKPRLSFDEFLSISNNVIKISACIQSPLSKYMLKIKDNHTEEQKQMIIKLLRHYDYYEIQYHNAPWQIEYNRYLYTMSKRFHKPLIVGTDTHSLNDYKAECRTILQYGKTDGAWGDEENDCDLTFKSYNELVEMFRIQNSLPMDVVLDAIENTNKMANSVEEITFNTDSKYPLLYGEDDEKMLWKTLKEKYNEKVERGEIDKNDKRYISAIKEEMSVFKKINMIGFMLFMSQIGSWAKENHIAMGFARGSCFTKDALVLTDNGYKPINEVNIGDKVISDDCKWHTVVNTLHYDVEEPMIEIKHYKQGSCYKKYKTQCTLDHKFLVNRQNNISYVEAKNLKVGDLLCSPKIVQDNNYSSEIIDFNDYNIFGYDYDDNYIYEKIFIVNKRYKYSPKWFQKNGYNINPTFCKNIIKGWKPKTNNVKTQKNIDALLAITHFKSLDDYKTYCEKRCYKIRPLKRYVKKDMLFNIVIGMMYGDGWTQRNYAIGLAVNNDSKTINKKLFYKFANKLNISSNDIYVNKANNGKNLQQLFINSHILNNYWKSNYFISKKGVDKKFNSKLLNQSYTNLKGLLYGLKITDGNTNKQANKINYDSTSLSLIGAYNILDNIVNRVMPNAIDVRLSYTDDRNYINAESYKSRRGIVKTTKSKYIEDDKYWYLPILEINHIQQHKNTVYDLTVEDRHSYVVNNILVHNCAGSTVAYISDIIDVDPIKWNTVFSRFANVNRVEEGDIDTDWYEDDRPKVYNYIINRFGTQNTAYILALGTLADKSVIDVIGKAFRIKAQKNGTTTPYTLDKIAEIKKEYDEDKEATREKYKDLFYYYDGLVGCITSQSQHPAGILVSPINLIDNVGAFYGSDGQVIVPLDMEECHELGLVKFDILGLKSVGVIDKTYKMIGKHFPKAYEVDWNDKAVFEDIAKDSTMIFQFESQFAHDSIKKMQPRSVEDLSLCSACLRPSGESYRDAVFSHEVHKNPSKLIDSILDNSNGFLVYQEQTIAFLQQVCGFSGSDADSIRRAIGKKNYEKIAEALPQIVKGYCDKSDKPKEIAEQEVKDYIKVIEDASGYSFGYNHSISYAMLSYLMGWLRYYYPTEFCTAYLNCAKNDEDLYNGTTLAKSKGCKIINPKFGFSSSEYGCDSSTKSIYKGLASIKNIGKDVGDKLYDIKDMHFDNFIDLLAVIDSNKICNSRELTILILINFFEQFGNPNYLLKVVEIYNKFGKCTVLKKEKLTQEEKQIVHNHANKETAKQFRDLDNNAIMYDMIQLYKNITTEFYEQIQYDIQYLGYTNIVRDTVKPSLCCVEALEINKYGTPYGTFYNIRTGISKTIKIDKKWYNEVCNELNDKLTVGSLVEIACRNKPKRRKQIDDNGKGHWVEDGVETIVTAFKIVY